MLEYNDYFAGNVFALEYYMNSAIHFVIILTLEDGTELVVRVAETADGTAYLNAWENEVVYHITAKDLANLKEKISLENQL